MNTLTISWQAWRTIRRKLKLQNLFISRLDYCYLGDDTNIKLTFDLEKIKFGFYSCLKMIFENSRLGRLLLLELSDFL